MWRKRNLLCTLAVSATMCSVQFGSAQVVKAPRYTGNVEAPVPQLNLPPLPAALTKGGTVVEDVVVRVNDQIISRSDVERSEQQLEQDAQQQQTSPAELAERQKDMLRDMIDQQLLLSKAKELGFNADADVIRQLDQIRIENKMSSMDELERAARQQGVSFEDFKAKIRNQILTQQVVRDEVGRRLQMSQVEEAKYYQEHAKEFERPEQVKLSEILVPLPENATPAEIVQAQKKADDLKTKVMQGADFADVAKKSSGGPSAAQGGELGLFKRGALAKVLEDQTFELKPGESTQPIRTRQGFVILKVTGHDVAGPAPMKEVEPQIQEALYMNAMQPALRAYLTKLREQAYVDIQPGFLDSGASAKETKPVFTAYAPPPVKKKKVLQKARYDGSGRFAAAKKEPVVASPDTTGGRTLTGAEAKPDVDTSTGLAKVSLPANTASNGKPAKIKREKVRFGQAPRNTLPAGDDEVATGADAPASTLSGTSAGAAAASTGGLGAVNADAPAAGDLSANPLNATVAPKAKTRFASKSAEVKEKKVQVASAKQQEKVKAKPIAESKQEKASDATQAAPLGLNGDTTKKPAKPAKVKGAPKERLEAKPKAAPAAPAEIAPTANPALAPTADTPASTRTTPVQNQNTSPAPVDKTPDTTLPPVTQPVPGSSNQGQPIQPVNPPQ